MNRRDFLKMSSLAAVVPSFGLTAAQKGSDKSFSPASVTDNPVSCFRVKPYVQLLDENKVSVVWMTTEKATGYVTWSQDGWETSRRAWNECDGLLDANTLVHRAVIEGFDSRKRLEYKVHSRVFANFGPYKVKYSRKEEVLSCVLKPVLPADGAITWAMFNDVHKNLAVYDRLIPHLSDISAFCVFNGDIISHVDNENDVLSGLLGPFSRVTQEAGLPVWYLRGNHETRGAFAREMRNYLALKNSNYYGSATIGGVRFVFIDTGEDKMDSHWAYSGLVDFDGYIARECEWLRREVASADWKNARARVVMRHIPSPFITANKKKWHSCLPRIHELDKILARANVTLAMAAHIHKWRWHEPIPERPYPMIVGGGQMLTKPTHHGCATLVKCRLDASGLSVKMVDQFGAVLINKLLRI